MRALLLLGLAGAAMLLLARRDAGGAGDSIAGAIEALVSTAGGIATALSGGWRVPPAGAPYAEYLEAAELREGMPAGYLGRIAFQESGFRPEVINGRVRGGVGEIGILQMRPEYAVDFGIDPLELTDPYRAIDAGAAYLRRLYERFGSWDAAIAAWNWGPTALARYGLEAAPATTKEYIAAVKRDVGYA